MSVIWISKDYLVNNSPIDTNIDFKTIEPIIKLVQDKYMLPLLGTDLYNAVNAAFEAKIDNGTSLPNRINLLKTYIFDAMVNYILAESTIVFKWRYTNKGLLEKSATDASVISTSDLKYIIDSWKNNAELYANQLVNYINFNNTVYPEYFSLTNNSYKIKKNDSAFNVDLYLGC